MYSAPLIQGEKHRPGLAAEEDFGFSNLDFGLRKSEAGIGREEAHMTQKFGPIRQIAGDRPPIFCVMCASSRPKFRRVL